MVIDHSIHEPCINANCAGEATEWKTANVPSEFKKARSNFPLVWSNVEDKDNSVVYLGRYFSGKVKITVLAFVPDKAGRSKFRSNKNNGPNLAIRQVIDEAPDIKPDVMLFTSKSAFVRSFTVS